jgi:hypothetical protein
MGEFNEVQDVLAMRKRALLLHSLNTTANPAVEDNNNNNNSSSSVCVCTENDESCLQACDRR